MRAIRSHPADAVLAVALAVTMTAAAALSAEAAPPLSPGQSHVQTAHSTPIDWRWQAMCRKLGSFAGSSTVIITVASGRQGTSDDRLRDLMRKCHNPNQRIVGYVGTDDTRVPLHQVKRQIDVYYDMYPDIDGIFLDDMSDKPDAPTAHNGDDAGVTVQAYYQQIFAHVRSKNVTQSWVASTTRLPRTNYVIGNAAQGTSTSWQLSTPVVDLLMGANDTVTKYRSWSAPARVVDDAATFSHVVYTVAPGTAGYSVRTAQELSRAERRIDVHHD